MPKKELPSLAITNLEFGYNQTPILQNLHLELTQGEIFALIGANGTGKSTLMRLISGLLRFQVGNISILGSSISQEPEAAKAKQLLLPDNPDIYPFLTGLEFLLMHASLRKIPKTRMQKELPKLLKLFPDDIPLDEQLSEQSRGTRQKIQFISALLTQPELLLFDEPIVGLDPASVTIFGEQLKKYSKQASPSGYKPTVLLALHTLDFAKSYADRVGILHQGNITGIKKIGSTDLYKHYKKYS